MLTGKEPSLLVSDEHTSRFYHDVTNYLHDQQIPLFISLPDTIDLTQLLDQINYSVHDNYFQHKKKEYLCHQSNNCEGFVNIISKMRATWSSKESIINAEKRIEIGAIEVNVEWMQQSKFYGAEKLFKNS